VVKKLYKTWGRLPVPIRAAIIVGVSAVFASSITLMGTFSGQILREFQEVRVVEIRPATVTSNPTTEIVLWNKSDITMPVTSVELSLAQAGLHLADGGASIYELHGAITSYSVNSGIIAGTILKSGQLQKTPEIKNPLAGSWTTWRVGGWKLILEMPVTEEIPSHGARTIVLILPETLEVRRNQPFNQLFDKILIEDFVSKDNRKFFLSSFLQYVGPIGISAEVVFADKKTSTYQGEILFRELGVTVSK